MFKLDACMAFLFPDKLLSLHMPLTRKQSAILEYALIGVLVAMAVTKGCNWR